MALAGCSLLLDPSEYLSSESSDGGSMGSVDSGSSCVADSECSDGQFCNGAESCDPKAAGADAFGCVAATAPCPVLCDDAADQCVSTCPTGTVAIHGQCRRSCLSFDDCGVDQACVEGGCLPLDEACGGCAGGLCPTTTVCRPAAGECDLAEFCDGLSTACPSDAVASASTTCRSGSGDVCDPDELCDGVGKSCPADSVASDTEVCRPADACGPAELCTGVALAPCPDDVVTVSCPGATSCDAATMGCQLSSGGQPLPLIFVTSTSIAALPLAESDAECQARADAANLDGTFVALLSSATVDAKDRVADRAYYRVDGVEVATSAADLFDGSVAATVSRTELNGDLSASAYSVRTGSNKTGTRAYDCEDWTTTAGTASMSTGLTNGTTTWLYVGNTPCNFGGSRLYCIQTD